MPITYRQHQDTRDGKIYNCVLMPDGKWWSVDDYRYDGSEWISPPDNYYWDAALAAARLYRRSTLIIPPGAHLPTSTEWTAMGTATGTLADSKPLRSAQGWDALRAGPDTYGFGMIGANGSPYPGSSWGSTGFVAKLLSANGIIQTSGGAPGLSIGNSPTPPDYYGSVRFIVDVFNDPYPLKLFGATFQGFERGLSCTIKRQILVDDSMGGSVTLTPVAPAAFDEWAIEAELWVSAAQAQVLEATVPPRGVPLENAIRLPPRGGEASFPGLLPFAQAADYDQYPTPMVTAFESLGQRAVGTDLFGYRIALSFFAEADGLALNGSPTPTTTPPTWLAGKASLRTIVDASNQGPVVAATTLAGHPSMRGSYYPVKHGRSLPVLITLDNLTTDWASELVAYFRGVRHNATTLQISNGPSGVEAVSVYLVGLTFARTGLTWSGSLEVVPA